MRYNGRILGSQSPPNAPVLCYITTWPRTGAAGFANAADIVALYAPSTAAAQPQLRQFVKYKMATAGNANYLTTGAGTYVCVPWRAALHAH